MGSPSAWVPRRGIPIGVKCTHRPVVVERRFMDGNKGWWKELGS